MSCLQRHFPSSLVSIEGHQAIIKGNCNEHVKRLPDSSIDVIITSPPYNIGVAYNSYKDDLSQTDYLHWLSGLSKQLARVLREGGSLFLNVGSTNVNPWLAHDVASAFREDFRLQNNIIWAKSVSIGDDSFGHFKPVNSRRFLNNTYENIFHFSKTGSVEIDRLAVGVPFKDKSNVARWGHKSDKRCAGNIWHIPYKTVSSKAEKFNHPAGFPEELPVRCLKLHGGKELTVLDPFLGAGTTLVAAEKLGYYGIGFEMDPEYADAAIKRIAGCIS